MNIRHKGQLKKIKFWGPFWVYMPAKQYCQMPIQPIYFKNIPNWPNWPNWQCFLAGSSKMAHRIFSIAMGADYSFELNSIETYAPHFLDIIIYS
jgi:hypothetical protein